MESLFDSTRRQHQRLSDEDAPPTSSVFDIPSEVPKASLPPHIQQRQSLLDSVFRGSANMPQRAQNSSPKRSAPVNQLTTPTWVIVFGYPIDKYASAVEYFQSLGNTATAPESVDEVQNCFRIGYVDPAEALRAVKKNGEVLGGTWMVGVRWAPDSHMPGEFIPPSPPPPSTPMQSTSNFDAAQTPHGQKSYLENLSPVSIGTPIRLAPSSSAFLRTGGARIHAPVSQHSQDQSQQPGVGVGAQDGQWPFVAGRGKGVFGQMSDMIFGW